MVLFPSLPCFIKVFESRIHLLSQLQEVVFDLCNATWQAYLLRWTGREREAQSAQIGNLLRGQFHSYVAVLKSSSDQLIGDLSGCCDEISGLTDRTLVSKSFKLDAPSVPTISELLALGCTSSPTSSFDLEQDLKAAIECLDLELDNRPCHVDLAKTLMWCRELYNRIHLRPKD
jgi:hypothetical protein